jgi:hypothetical protein
MIDAIVDEVRRVREELIQRYGGLEGYLKQCEEQNRRRRCKDTGNPRSKRRRKPTRSRKRNLKP